MVVWGGVCCGQIGPLTWVGCPWGTGLLRPPVLGLPSSLPPPTPLQAPRMASHSPPNLFPL